jgi:hypothetical protein
MSQRRSSTAAVTFSKVDRSFDMQLIMGWAGVLCVSVLLYKALAVQNVLFFGALALVFSVMWLLMLKHMIPTAKVTVRSGSFVLGSQLSQNITMFVANYYFAFQPAQRISVFALVNLAYLLAFLSYCQQQRRGAKV